MKDPFQLFWQKNRRDTLIKAAIIGASAAALICAAVLLTAKILDFPTGYCLLGWIALPVGAGLFLLFRRTGLVKFAKKLDNDFELHEKVQTMVEFEQAKDDMAVIQREDTLQKLGAIPLSRLRFRHLWVYIVLPLLAAGMMVTAIACPEKPDEPYVEPQEPPRQTTDWEWAKLDSLINYVEKSEADETFMKPDTLRALYALKNLLKNGVTESALRGVVTTTVTQINNAHELAKAEETLSEEQKRINEQVCEYTVHTLYEIFGLTESENTQNPDDSEKKDPKEDEDDKKFDGSGELGAAADDKLFDASEGYVAYIDVIGKYQSEINKAFSDGMLTQEEYDDLMSYFGLLYSGKEND